MAIFEDYKEKAKSVSALSRLTNAAARSVLHCVYSRLEMIKYSKSKAVLHAACMCCACAEHTLSLIVESRSIDFACKPRYK